MLNVDIRKAFPGLSLDVTFTTPSGVTAIYGPSGCGKTSTVNAIAGLLRPDDGQVALNGRTLFDQTIDIPTHRRRIGYVFQDARLFPHMTVGKNLSYGSRHATSPPDTATRDRIIAMLGLSDLLSRRPAGLSGGEQQRVAIGRALLSAPDLLIMDEPLASLDPARKAEILPYLTRLRLAGGPPILYVSHAMSEIASLADTIIAMRDGRVTYAGPLQTALSDPETALLIGETEGGALLSASLTAQSDDDLSRLETPLGPLWLPRIDAPVGTHVRLRILAHEVILSRIRPEGLSALNVVATQVTQILSGPDRVLVQLAAGSGRLLAAVTARSAKTLELAPGVPCFAILKTVAMVRTG